MERRIALPLFALVGLTALARPSVSRAAGETPAPGTIMTVAGDGTDRFSGDGGPAAKAAVGTALHLGFDAAGNLFVAENGDERRVRRISPDGNITTVAGSGVDRFSGDGGPATKAGMQPVAVVVDRDDNLYISDIGNSRVRKVSASGIITTYAGGGNPADGVGDGGPATSARLNWAGGIALDANGNLYFTDDPNHRVRMVTPAGTISTVAGTGKAGFAGDGGPAAAAQLNMPYAVAVDDAGRLFIADFGNHRIRMVGLDGTISTVAGGGAPADGLGDGGPATQALLSGPFGLAIDKAGNLFFSDRGPVTVDGTNIVGADNERIREVVGVGVPR
jgi:hypothetical protein